VLPSKNQKVIDSPREKEGEEGEERAPFPVGKGEVVPAGEIGFVKPKIDHL